MNFGRYPFDEHVCFFEVSSFMHSDTDIAVRPGLYNRTKLVNMASLDKYNVGQFQVSPTSRTYSFTKQNGDLAIRGEFDLKRTGNIFALEILLPEILLHISLYASFWIPSDSPPARVALCIISALSFRIMRTDLSISLPPVSYSIW
jgi:hypothetical protein